MSQIVFSRGGTRNSGFVMNFSLKKSSFGSVGLVFGFVLIVTAVTVMTLVFSTNQVTKGYILNSLDQTNRELERQQEINAMKISEIRSLNYIQNTSKVKKMVRPWHVAYAKGESIASR